MRTVEYWTEVPIINPVGRKLRFAQAMASKVARGEEPAIYLCGPPGIGKSHIIARALREWSAIQDARLPHSVKGRLRDLALSPVLVHVRSYLEALEQFHAAAQFRKVGCPRAMVFEEADEFFRSSREFNLLKIATGVDPDAKRFSPIRFLVDDAETGKRVKVDGEWLDAPLFFSTNLDLSQLADKPGPHRSDADAVFSRCAPIAIPDDDPEAIWEWTIYLSLTSRLTERTSNGRAIPLDVQEQAVKWFSEHFASLRTPGPRALRNIARDFVDWRGIERDEALKLHLSREPLRRWERMPTFDWGFLKHAFTMNFPAVQKAKIKLEKRVAALAGAG